MQKINYIYNKETPSTVENFLKYNGISARLLRKLKRQPDGLTKNGSAVRSIDIVEKGDEICLNINDSSFLEPNASLDVSAAYENDYIVIFDKPPYMPVHPSVKHQGDTLGNYFASLYPELTFRPINRLDRNTSGLCAAAKNPHSANILQHNIIKTYYAVVCGRTEPSGTVNAPIARESESIIKRIVRDDGKPAVTHYKTLLQNEKYSLVEIHLETGRTHQIRVHFAYIGCPLAGDELYGGNTDDISRHALHCGKLIFNDIFTNREIVTVSDIKTDMLNLFRK